MLIYNLEELIFNIRRNIQVFQKSFILIFKINFSSFGKLTYVSDLLIDSSIGIVDKVEISIIGSTDVVYCSGGSYL